MLKILHWIVVAAALVAFTLLCFGYPHGQKFLDAVVTVEGRAYHYRVYRPLNWSANKKWPVILFLHGAGERGNDNMSQTNIGIGAFLRKHHDLPAVVVLPQAAEGKWWTDPDMELYALHALDEAMKRWSGDPDRIFLTGISMGGYGTWSMASRHPEKFAAIVPVCGGIRSVHIAWHDLTVPAVSVAENPYAQVAKGIVCPVWAFHGSKDDVIPVVETYFMVRSLLAAGRDARQTIYENGDHHIWDETYANPELWRWLFSKKLAR